MEGRDVNFTTCLFAWFVFLISEALAALIIHNMVAFGNVIWNAEEISKPLWSNHALIMVVTMILMNGNGMMMFRLFPKCRTVFIKYLHALIHTMILIGSGYAYYLIHSFKADLDRSHFTFQQLHAYLAVLTAILYICQWASAVFVYLYMYSNQRRRKLFASWHNFLGVCVLQISIITACVQLQDMNYKKNFEKQHAEHAMVLMVIYGALVNCVVLNPYLEWRLVGPL
ncbi:uncharacterized protein LOC129911439 isoform X2 [Episyrphus balteatus]|uniref:uncharacterized protein LOC129911439 isoform X2 n=1 Tax=Episyrphus balteatus TaxID=286459 RepID=UPI0024855FFD|nr:uncharacterized protein LOC129911439 isoform X2 [Episyrphus balteatus]